MISINIQINGEAKLNQALGELGNGVTNLIEGWLDVEQTFYEIETKLFRTEGASGGQAWPALTAKYAAQKSRRFPGRGILRLTGDLQRSLTGRGAGGIREIRPMEMTLGTTVPYAIFHQTGTRRMRARPPIQLSAADERRILRTLTKTLLETSRKTGFEVTDGILGSPPITASVPF